MDLRVYIVFLHQTMSQRNNIYILQLIYNIGPLFYFIFIKEIRLGIIKPQRIQKLCWIKVPTDSIVHIADLMCTPYSKTFMVYSSQTATEHAM